MTFVFKRFKRAIWARGGVGFRGGVVDELKVRDRVRLRVGWILTFFTDFFFARAYLE